MITLIDYSAWKEAAQEAINDALEEGDFKTATDAAAFLAQVELAHKYSGFFPMLTQPISLPPQG